MGHEIGTIISQSRQNQGMTQEEFASRLGVTPQAVSKWERQVGMPDISLVEGICNILQISANKLLGIAENRVVEDNDLILEKEICSNMFAEPLVIEFGNDLVPCFIEGLKTDFVNQKRKELVKKTGMLAPLLRIRDDVTLEKNEICIKCYDKILVQKNVENIDEATYEELITLVFDECQTHYDEILNKQIVKTLIDNLKEQYPGVADGLIPEKISYLTLKKHLQKRVREQGNIRDMIHILEELEGEVL